MHHVDWSMLYKEWMLPESCRKPRRWDILNSLKLVWLVLDSCYVRYDTKLILWFMHVAAWIFDSKMVPMMCCQKLENKITHKITETNHCLRQNIEKNPKCWYDVIWWYDMLRLPTGTPPRCGSHRGSDAHRPIPAKRGHHEASKTSCVKVLYLRAPPIQITTDSKLPHHVVYKTNTKSPPDWCCNAVGVGRLDGAIDVRTAPEANSETSGIQDEHN